MYDAMVFKAMGSKTVMSSTAIDSPEQKGLNYDVMVLEVCGSRRG